MPRNRVIYQSEGLYVSQTATSTTSGQHYQLDRVQSANYNFNIARQDVNQFGELARIDSIVLESPTVSLDFSYYLTDGANEAALGFYVPTGSGQAQRQFPSGQLEDGSGQNFYIVTTSEGADLNSESNLSGKSVIGIGNAYLTDYTVDLSVGNIPTVSVSMEGSNMNAFTISGTNSGSNAAINQASGTKLNSSIILGNPSSQTGTNIVNALRPGDVTVSFGSFTGTGAAGVTELSNLHLQSASLSLPLGRTPIDRLGSKFAYVRTVDFPINATLTINGIQNDTSNGSLVDLVEANPKQDITITVNKPGTSIPAVRYTMKRAQLDSVGLSSSIGANKTADLTFTTQIGGVNDNTNGIQMSGSYSGVTIFS
jgi:hypothetical protein